MNTYSINISGTKGGNPVQVTHIGVKGYTKDDALLSLYRSCQVDPFIENRIITITKEN